MSLTRTAPVLLADSEPLAAKHRDLLLAADELIDARFNRRTWLVFDIAPQLVLGDVCVFGTPTNLSVGAYPAYDPAEETPTDPIGGAVVSVDTLTRVIWLTGYADTTTLNRRTVEYDRGLGDGPETWWIGTTKPQRWEPMRIADVCVEAYEDPVAGVTNRFTWRSHWDKHGCLRVHNGNRFALTLEFEDASHADVVIPPYGILCGRRPHWDEPFVFEESWYLPLTRQNDRLIWEATHSGQYAASMENLVALVEEMYQWVRYVPVLDADSTAREQGSFTGSAPTGSDYLWDWLIHPGKLLSVVLDRRDGTTTVTELEWAGIGSVPDPSWSGHVTVSLAMGDTLAFTSDATAPSGAGPTEWEHDLIPITTNLTSGYILSLVDGTVTLPVAGGGDSEEHYTHPLLNGTVQSTTTTVYSCGASGSPTMLLQSQVLAETAGGLPSLEATVAEWAPAPSGGSTGISKSFGAIGRWGVTSASSFDGPSVFSETLLDRADTSSATMTWLTAKYLSVSDRRRFLARQPRKYYPAGEDDGGTAVYPGHPQDSNLEGTPDGLGGAIGQVLQPILTSQVAIEGSPWTKEASEKGTFLYIPGDALHTVASRINEAGWWAANRDRILASTMEPEDVMIAWRIPRVIEEWNALAKAMNAVAEVFRADIRHLYKDPLPSDVNHPPGSYSGEHPFAVPLDWVCGRHESDDLLADWCAIWSVPLQMTLPDIDALAALERLWWATANNPVVAITKLNEEYFSPTEGTNTINGYTYGSYKRWSPDASRLLFGWAGAWDDYVWLTYTDLTDVFDPLGVAVPPPPVGERFTPVIEEDSGVTALNGSLSSGTPGTYTKKADAQTVYRHPSSSGTWLNVWAGELAASNPGGGFRLCAVVGSGDGASGWVSAKEIVWWSDADATEFTVYQRDQSTAAVDNGPLSPRAKTLWQSSHFHELVEDYIDVDDNAWRSGIEIHSITPYLVIAAPELWCSFAWDDPMSYDIDDPIVYPSVQYSIDTHPYVGGGLKAKEYEAGAVAPSTLASDGWATHAAYHCQVVQRTGVLRS